MTDQEMTDQKEYQLTSIIPPLLDRAGLIELLQKIKKWILELGGSLKGESIVKRNLGYPIKKYQQAFYARLTFTLAPKEIDRLQKQLKFEENILRYLIIGLKPKVAQFQFPDIVQDKIKPAEFKKTPPQKEEPLIKPEPKVKLEELDKKLEEILGQ